MKNIISPATNEHAEYTCDVSGDELKDFVPCQVKVSFGYGSRYDGDLIELHFSDEVSEKFLSLLKEFVSEEKLKAATKVYI
jgi:hypothetical protein